MRLLKTINEILSDGTSLTKEYADYEMEHLRLKMFYHLAKLSVEVSKNVVIGIVLLLFCFFSSVAFALYLASVTGSTAIGFLIIAIIYLILACITYLQRQRIEKYVVNKLSSNFLNYDNV